MAASGYVYDQGWEQERARLAGIEALWDPGTQAILAACGARSGARVLEAGAGGGSIVAWLSQQVGSTGSVLAVDTDTRFVEPLRSSVIQVTQLNLVTGELPAAEFDLVHARLVLEHIPEREEVLDHLVRTVKPGGWIVIEDYDWTSFGFESADEAAQRAATAVLGFMTAAGFDGTYGRRLTGALARRGLTDVYGDGRSRVIDRTTAGFDFFRLSFEQLAPVVVDAGLLSSDDAESVRVSLGSDDQRIITPTLIAARGKRVSS